MQTALDFPEHLLSEEERKLVDVVRDQGWAVVNIPDSEADPGFTYSVGFWRRHGHPEVLTFLPGEIGNQVIANVQHMISQAGWLPIDRIILDVLEGYPVVLRPMAKSYYEDYLGWNQWFYRGLDVPCLQLFLPDENGCFPWELPPDDSAHNWQLDLTARPKT